MKVLFILFIIFSMIGCKTYSDDDLKIFDKQIQKYLKKQNIQCKKSESGLYFKIIQEGKGEYIQYNDKVSFTYKGKLLNGTVFDNQQKPVSFQIKELIAGWKEMLLQSKPGAKIFMVLPPNLGYGSNDLDHIPPNSILTFEMNILNVE
ncbi:MAG: FKBP-type peptidyl-prolyl cis-trans isomerase [Flavobacteriia bacterium]|nr:FKBP-type peptidyl-prolyl cis-trans isomerase [Flavobacteriia bacterium]